MDDLCRRIFILYHPFSLDLNSSFHRADILRLLRIATEVNMTIFFLKLK